MAQCQSSCAGGPYTHLTAPALARRRELRASWRRFCRPADERPAGLRTPWTPDSLPRKDRLNTEYISFYSIVTTREHGSGAAQHCRWCSETVTKKLARWPWAAQCLAGLQHSVCMDTTEESWFQQWQEVTYPKAGPTSSRDMMLVLS